MIRIAALLLVFMSSGIFEYVSAQQTSSEQQDRPVGKAFEVHGQLGVYNGTPSCRIWIVGTKRILGIRDTETECAIPSELLQALKEDINDRWIYGDFTVVPLTKHREGVMQSVAIETAKNIVITTGEGRFLKSIKGTVGISATQPANPRATISPKRGDGASE